jgi:nucleotide-binding universal stress UspA family protein
MPTALPWERLDGQEVSMTTSTPTARAIELPPWLGTVFDRIVCGVDETESSRVAVRQATRLLRARCTLDLVSVVEPTNGPWGLSVRSAEVERRYEEAQRALRDCRAECPRARSALLFGTPGPALVGAVRSEGATLAAAGALGEFATHLLHEAPCSVLIARPSGDDMAFPRTIAVGHDGSPGAAAAFEVAHELAHRFAVPLRTIAATGRAEVETEGLPPEEALERSELPPVEALAAASAEVDLLVVGSRGRRGLRALGSVSERVGHVASSSVLVVREPEC